MRKITAAILIVLLSGLPASAEDINSIFKKVNDLAEQGNFPKAIEELAWAKNELEKMHFEKLSTMIPDNLAGFQGKKIKSQAAMGFQSVERQYQSGREQIRLTLTGGNTAGGQGGLAALGRMAAMMGGSNGGSDTFRIDGRTANLTTQNNRSELTVYLDSGSILKLELRNSEEPEKLRAAVKEIDVAGLDSYLKGS